MEGSLKQAYLLASLGSTKTFWLYHIQPFLTKTSKETCLDIHLPDFINAANANMIPTEFKHHYEWENLIVVNSLNLWKTFCHKSSFMDGDITIHVRLLLKDPFTSTALRPSSSTLKVYTLFSYMDPLGFYGFQPFVGIWAHHRFSIARRFSIVQQHDFQDRITLPLRSSMCPCRPTRFGSDLIRSFMITIISFYFNWCRCHRNNFLCPATH